MRKVKKLAARIITGLWPFFVSSMWHFETARIRIWRRPKFRFQYGILAKRPVRERGYSLRALGYSSLVESARKADWSIEQPFLRGAVISGCLLLVETAYKTPQRVSIEENRAEIGASASIACPGHLKRCVEELQFIYGWLVARKIGDPGDLVYWKKQLLAANAWKERMDQAGNSIMPDGAE